MFDPDPMDEALKLLSRKAYSETQLKIRLGKFGFCNEAIAACLFRLKTWGYLNDHASGEARIRLLQSRCKSREYVRCDLTGNGIVPDLAAELLNQFYPLEMEVAIARKLVAKRFGIPSFSLGDQDLGTAIPVMTPPGSAGKTAARAVAKAAASLARAGFAEETIRRCFSGEIPAISST